MAVNELVSEAELIQRVIAGEKEEYEKLVIHYQSFCFTLANRILNNRMEAEEATQDAFIKAYRSLKYFSGKAKFSSWLYRIVYNTAISYYRKRKNHEDFEIVKYDHSFSSENQYSEKQDRVKFIKEAIDRLNPQDATIISLFYYEELSLEEISKIMALRTNLVKVKLHRARKKLATELKVILKEEVETL